MNKYEFLTRKDLKYKPNALDKARFEFSSLGKAFSTGLDKTAEGYQEEGVIKLLKDIRDGLAGNVIRLNNRPNRFNDRPDRPDDGLDRPDRPDDGSDNESDRSDDRPDDRPDDNTLLTFETRKETVIRPLLEKINDIDRVNKQYKDTINNINKQNDDYLKKNKRTK